MNTDGTTEPIIAVIGHPIAGNPSQLAIERSLLSLGMEWRVLSFDVQPQHVGKALDGFSVTGIAGVFVASGNLHRAAAEWFADYVQQQGAATNSAATPINSRPAEAADPDAAHPGDKCQAAQPSDGPPDDSAVDLPDTRPDLDRPLELVDCFDRGDNRCFLGSFQRGDYLANLVGRGSAEASHRSSHFSTLWIGPTPLPQDQDDWPAWWDLFANTVCSPDHDPDEPLPDLAGADLVVLADTRCVTFDQWCQNDGSTTVIVLGDQERGDEQRWLSELSSLGYRVVSPLEVTVGSLLGCIQRWTRERVPSEPVAEAIEEYYGV